MRKKNRFKLRKLFVFFLSISLLILQIPVQVQAASGDFSIDFAAAAPYSYNHLTGGGAFDDGTIGSHADVVESLEGGDFRCGDIVTYLVQITVNDTDSADADAPQTIALDFEFLADTTGQSGVAIIDIKSVKINYGTIEDLIPGEDSIDSGIHDDGGSQATLVDEYFTGTPYTSGAVLHGTVVVDDLERGETVILRIDVKLGCKPGSTPTGNLQADLQGAWLIATGSGVINPPEAISSGRQTVPFKQIGDIGAADIEIEKTVRLAGSTDHFSESISVLNGTAVEYRYVVTNLATTNPPGAPLYDVTVIDDNGTPSNKADDFNVPLTGLTDIDGDGHADDLAIGATATGTAIRTITTTLNSVINTAVASGKDSLYMPNTLTDSDTATVLVERPLLELTKTGTFNAGSDGFADPGELITYTFVIRNTGNVPLTNVTVTDPLLGSITLSNTTIAVGGQVTGTKTYAVSQADIDAGFVYNLATADSDESDADEDDHHQPLPKNPDIELEKTGAYVDENADGIFSIGDKITYTFAVKNTGNVTLTHVILTDPLITIAGGPITSLAPDQTDSTTFSGVYWLTQADIDRGNFTNIATVTGTPPSGEDVTDTDDDTQQFVQSPQLELDKAGIFDAGLDGFADLGELITYTFVVRNTGNVTLTNVTVTDPLVGTITLSSTTIQIGGYVTGTKTYAVTQIDIDAGFVDNLATADSDESDSDDDNHHQPLPQNPLLELEKTGVWVDGDGDGWAQAGETVIYTFTVSNIGNVTLHDVTLTDPKIPIVTYVSGDDGDNALQIDETWVYTAEYHLTQADVDAGFVDNAALADSGESDNDEGDETIILPQNVSIQINKTTNGVDGPVILVGTEVHWQYVVTNTGNVTLSDITVVDDQGVIPVYVSGDLNQDGLLDLDETWVFEATRIAVEGAYVNKGTATGMPLEGEPVSDEDDSQYFGYVLGIHIEKDVANFTQKGLFDDYAELVEDETARYRLTIDNDSNVSLINIIVTDTHAAPGTVVTITGGGTLTWSAGTGGLAQLNLGSLAAGAQIVLTYDYRTLHSDIGDVIINTATVSGEPGVELDLDENPILTNEDDAIISIEAVPLSVSSLSIEKMVRNQTANGVFDDMATGYVGNIFCYFVEVINDGSTLLSNVILIDDHAAIGSQLLKTGSSIPMVWTDNGSGKASITIGSLAPGESVGFTYRYTAKTEDEGDVIINTAKVKAEYIPALPGYENIPLEQSAEATIALHETPPQTGESGTTGLSGLGFLMIVLAGAVMLLRRQKNLN